EQAKIFYKEQRYNASVRLRFLVRGSTDALKALYNISAECRKLLGHHRVELRYQGENTPIISIEIPPPSAVHSAGQLLLSSSITYWQEQKFITAEQASSLQVRVGVGQPLFNSSILEPD